MSGSHMEQEFERFRADFDAMRHEIAKVLVGQEEVIDGLLTALVAGGHVLLEGLPGMGKTVLVQTLADVLELGFQRIQCTADLMATDVLGTYVIMETAQGRRSFEFQRGPLFSNLVLAEQINRTMPKTQSAFLEAMDTASITVATETFSLPRPFFLVATQNPLDMEGTYPLPEAQIDRFFAKLRMSRPNDDQMEQILDRTTANYAPVLKKATDADRIGTMADVVREVPLAGEERRWAIGLVGATHPESDRAPTSVRKYVRCGCGPRGARAMILAAKVRAILQRHPAVTRDDLRAACPMTLRHRLILNFEGQAENIDPDTLVADLLLSTGGT